jgi:Domain of unknown function (DUF4124)
MSAVQRRVWVLGLLVTSTALACPGAYAVNGGSSGFKSGGPVAYRWVDEHGVVHYGDRIPPQYAQQERAVLNKQGIEVGHQDAPKTPEEAAAAERAHQEVIRQKQHDSFLVSTYTSVKDIEALRDVRLDQLRGQRTAAEQYIDTLRSRLAALQTRALMFRPYSARVDARRMPDDLAEDLVRTVNEFRTQSNALAAKGEEETALKAQFQADIERYRELHAVNTHR